MMQQQQTQTVMTHVALVCMDGDTDATLAPSYEAALDLLRARAQHWDWELDPEHPLDRETATLEQLCELYAHDGDEDCCWVDIASLWDPCLAVVLGPDIDLIDDGPRLGLFPTSAAVSAWPSPVLVLPAPNRLAGGQDDWAWEEDGSDDEDSGDQGTWMEEHLDVLRGMSGKGQHAHSWSMTARVRAGLLLFSWVVIAALGILTATFPAIAGAFTLPQLVLLALCVPSTVRAGRPERDKQDREEARTCDN